MISITDPGGSSGNSGGTGSNSFNALAASLTNPTPILRTRNLTVLLQILQSLSATELEQLYSEIDVEDRNELLSILQPTMHVKSYEQNLMQYGDYKLHKQLLLYVPPILVILGTFGNISSFIILKRKAMLKFSTYFYLMILAIADTLVLYVGLLRLWIGELTGYDIRDEVNWLCKLTNVVGYTISDFSVWLIIAVTVERYIVVCYPLKANNFCNTQRAKKVTLVLFLIFLCLNMHFLWTVQIVYYTHKGERIPQCAGGKYYKGVVADVWPWIDAMLYSFLPFVIIIILNGLIIRQVVLARRTRSELRSGTGYEQRRPSHEGNTRLTIMLLTISFAFLLTTLPMNIVNITTSHWNQYTDDLHLVSKYRLARTITELLMYVNHSMNFFLYCATGQKFRHQLVWMLCYGKCKYKLNWNSENSQATRLESMRVNPLRARNAENGEVMVTLRNEMYTSVKCSI